MYLLHGPVGHPVEVDGGAELHQGAQQRPQGLQHLLPLRLCSQGHSITRCMCETAPRGGGTPENQPLTGPLLAEDDEDPWLLCRRPPLVHELVPARHGGQAGGGQGTLAPQHQTWFLCTCTSSPQAVTRRALPACHLPAYLSPSTVMTRLYGTRVAASMYCMPHRSQSERAYPPPGRRGLGLDH